MAVEPSYLRSADEARRSIPIVVKHLMLARGVSLAGLALALGVSKSSASARLNGHTRFSADELASLGELFEVEPGFFFRDPVSFFGPADQVIRARRCISAKTQSAEPAVSAPLDELALAS